MEKIKPGYCEWGNLENFLLTFSPFQAQQFNEKDAQLIQFDSKKSVNINIQFLPDFLNSYFLSELPSSKNIVDVAIDIENLNELRVLNAEYQKILLKDLATGYQNLYALYYNLRSRIEKCDQPDIFLAILVEEPEAGLHPKFQKLIPKILEDLKGKKENIGFLISTHSPFIISAAAGLPHQKVYLIEGGQTVDIYGKKGEGTHGYEDGNCILAANKMLGVGLEDIFPTILFFCENSFSEFLESFIKTQKINFKPVFITGGGDSDFIQKGSLWKTITKKLVAYQKDQYIKVDIKIVIDNDPEIQSQINKIEGDINFKKDLIKLEDDEQEKAFWRLKQNEFQKFLSDKGLSNWDFNEPTTNTFTMFLNKNGFDKKAGTVDEKKAMEKQQGIIKSELAKYMGLKITKDELKQFSLQLYTCIFGS